MKGRPRLVSVVIPAYNAASTIDDQLTALSQQSYAGEWEVVVADNGSTDRTCEIVRDWQSRMPNLALTESSAIQAAAHARNAGVQTTNGDLLAFCDADDAVVPGWLEALVAAAADYALVGGAMMAATRDADGWTIGNEIRVDAAFPFASSANCCVWRDVLDDLGGWDETFVTREDFVLSWRAHLDGRAVGFAPDAVVHYRTRPGAWAAARQRYQWERDEVLLLRTFHGAGLRCRPISHAIKDWARLVLGLPSLLFPQRRLRWLLRGARCVGRLSGSVRYRTLAP